MGEKNMLGGGALAEVAGPLKDFAEKLGGEEGLRWLEAFKRFLRKEEPWELQPALLKRITTVAVPVPGVQYFVAKDHLKAANVGWTGDNFKRLFLNNVEENVHEAKLTVSRLERASLDASILTELGDKAEVKLSCLFDLLKKQSKGEDGVLLANGYANIFYIRDADGNLWAVYADWDSGDHCWGVEAYSVESPFGWRDGDHVFSRDS